mmetsp:Transcript_15775/g.23900  ORF Transcript_15775/g.23900 Transcript_15775/m.23900 type:complete len:81 (+) Transcript_15775:156-398(+)|eukprot:CAMPEP_0178898368 /NCGR_PEP_ID=MMETSP0786-20121207/2291_1 /TAXON_ID=186022 /ORGANISM="Thalassionema frauenfeldii, Strain CCMP 1798" /LENGTH=80 /DNA_ID=CAMNT_0020569077 /DNA_START=123 /DNA_END=365 /DNA_ORIENTATION=+
MADDELERLQRECASMVTLLKQLEKEEFELNQQNKILAREAVLCGYQSHLIEPNPPKRRRSTAAKKKTAATPPVATDDPS